MLLSFALDVIESLNSNESVILSLVMDRVGNIESERFVE
jgi:hypothetical protein